MIIRIFWLFVVFCFFSSFSHAGYYAGEDDMDASFQGESFDRAFPPDTTENISAPTPYEEKPVKQKSTRNKKEVRNYSADSYDYNLPRKIQTSEKVIIVDPNLHAWGAYNANGDLIRAGRATAGNTWCSDIGRSCKTSSGVFRIYSLGNSDCVSSKYPIEEGGGAPMPYCMYFNGSEGLHGSNQVVEGNISHGCVRLRVSDAAWLRYHFVDLGTMVVVKPY